MPMNRLSETKIYCNLMMSQLRLITAHVEDLLDLRQIK